MLIPIFIPLHSYKFRCTNLPTETEYSELKDKLNEGIDVKLDVGKKEYLLGLVLSEVIFLFIAGLCALIGFLLSLMRNPFANFFSVILYLFAIFSTIGTVISFVAGLLNIVLLADYAEKFKIHIKHSKNYEQFVKYFKPIHRTFFK